MLVLALVSVTLVVMTAAAGVSLSLIRVTNHRLAWQLMALGIAITAVRRAYLLFIYFAYPGSTQFQLVPELFSFSIAAFLLGGLMLLHPMMAGIRRAHADERASDDNFFRLAVNMLCITDMDGHFLRLNPAWEHVLGYSQAAMLGRRFFEFIHPDDLERTAREMHDLSQGGVTQDFMNRYRAKDGSYRWIRWTAQADAGRQRVYAAATDVTELRAAEEELLMLRNAVAQSTSLIMITAPSYPAGAIVFVNESCETITGYRREELIGHDVGSFLGVQSDPATLQLIREAMTFERSLEVDLLQYRKDGSSFWSRVSLSPIRDKSEQLHYYLVVLFDISAHRKMEDDLRRHRDELDQLVQERTEALNHSNAELLQSTERLTQAQRIARIGDWEFNLSTGQLHWSEGMYHLYERSGAVEEQLDETPLLGCAPEDQFGLAEAAQRCVAEGQPVQHEFRALLPGNRYAHHLCSMQPRFDASGAVVRLVGTVQDITERREAELARQRYEDRMRQAQKLESLGILAGGIAHDFNNLLMGILGNASLLRGDLADKGETSICVDEIEKAAQRAAELTSQMLAYAGRGRLLVRPHDLSTVVRDISGTLMTLAAPGHRIQLALKNGLPTVRCDIGQLQQVLHNLVTNAAESMEGKTGVITLRTGEEVFAEAALFDVQAPEPCPPGRYVYVEVQDEGCGIPAELHERVFDPFYTTKFAGRGLGLAATLGIVHGHGGAVYMSSTPGAGSTFRLYFPASASETASSQAVSHGAPVETASGVILIVDDEALVRRAAHQILERAGYSVLEASNGHEALDLFGRHADTIRAVLLDLTMPGMNGEATLRELVRLREDVKVLLSSGYSEQDAVARFEGQRETHFLQKPYTAHSLLKALSLLLAGEPASR